MACTQVHANAHAHIWSRSRRSWRFVEIGRATENRSADGPPTTRRNGMHEPQRFMRQYSSTRCTWHVYRCMQTRMITIVRVQDDRGDLSRSAGPLKIGQRTPQPRAATACMNRTVSCAHIRTCGRCTWHVRRCMQSRMITFAWVWKIALICQNQRWQQNWPSYFPSSHTHFEQWWMILEELRHTP